MKVAGLGIHAGVVSAFRPMGVLMTLRPNPPSRPSIIVMDRDRPTLARLCDLLQSKGYAAVGAESAPAACRIMHGRQVNLVLTTIALPDEERLAWASALSRLDVKVPVIAMCEASSIDTLDLFDTANEFGAAAVLQRPFTARALLQVLADLLPPVPRDLQSAVRLDWPGLVSGSTALH
jgi:DNA-binding NtrC family response regulator